MFLENRQNPREITVKELIFSNCLASGSDNLLIELKKYVLGSWEIGETDIMFLFQLTSFVNVSCDMLSHVYTHLYINGLCINL